MTTFRYRTCIFLQEHSYLLSTVINISPFPYLVSSRRVFIFQVLPSFMYVCITYLHLSFVFPSCGVNSLSTFVFASLHNASFVIFTWPNHTCIVSLMFALWYVCHSCSHLICHDQSSSFPQSTSTFSSLPVCSRKIVFSCQTSKFRQRCMHVPPTCHTRTPK